MIVKVVLRSIKDIIYVEAGRFGLELNDEIVLKTNHGIEAGTVCDKVQNTQGGNGVAGKVLRKMTDKDRKRLVENEKKSSEVWNTVLRKVRDCGLDMKLTCIQYILDRSKLFVYYTSETRVDFREFIKDLGYVLRTRIQMVQIGVRDESKIFGGIGICGRVLCCQSFLRDFSSVTVDMVKEQNLSLNTSKVSGICGRLMCCIAYENETYKDVKKNLPEIGKNVLTPEGEAKLVAVDCIKEMVTVDFGDKIFKMFAIKQIEDMGARRA